MIVLPDGYLPALLEHCHERGCCSCSTRRRPGSAAPGATFASSATRDPDFLTLSKTLGAGLPLAACSPPTEIEERAHERGFLFYTTHVSDPLPAAVGLAVIEVIVPRATRGPGAGWPATARERPAANCSSATMHRRRPRPRLLLGLEMVADRVTAKPAPEPGAAISRRCFELGLSMNIVQLPAMGGVFRIAPPLTVTDAELDLGLDMLDRAITDVTS